MIFSVNIQVQTMDFGRQRGFLLDGEDPPEKVGCRKESYFQEFMYVDVARDFVGVVFHVLLDGATGSHNHWDCCCFKLPPSLNLDFQVFVSVCIFISQYKTLLLLLLILLLSSSPG